MTEYGILLPPDAELPELKYAGSKFPVLGAAESLTAAARNRNENAFNMNFDGGLDLNDRFPDCRLRYDLLDRNLSELIPGENAKMRLEYLGCLNEKIASAAGNGAGAVLLFFDWGRAEHDADYYCGMLEILRGTESILRKNAVKAFFPVRIPERGVAAGFFRKLIFDLKGGPFALAADFHLHDPAFGKSEWQNDWQNTSFETGMVLYSYEPALGNRLSENPVRETVKFFERHDLPLEVFFAPAKLRGTEFFRDELENLGVLRGALC